ncbi:hypothetical protein acsn021_31480 [Anaerocolumna cellulosilytica]|uniref:Endolytic murein transglycosylase n=1 Tax=Anaerocolumna cellulosilytica TaxID=433286 RepID=A0A6S6R2L8_9FIRM|nr:endolytic transglycosylase MltG [Anaerocolumna cellulosilytica]MBB5198078.1 putative YceG family protein [Anaerocolumna cellulosilytica]BCJ95579.1 hypothetical protein acsn021_31480 [Anaerocolumna cellulosilytica]
MKKNSAALIIIVLLIFSAGMAGSLVQAEGINYGLLIVDKNGTYTFWDLENEEGAGVEITESGSIMIPLKDVCALMPDVKFNYNTKTKTSTVVNLYNGRKVVLKSNENKCTYYALGSKKGVKKALPHASYISAENKAIMIEMSALKWVMGNSKGVKSFKVTDLQAAGYDTLNYEGVILYNPYGEVSALPLASKVSNLGRTVKVTIPEGFSVSQIFDLLVKKGVSSSTKELYEIMDSYDFSYYLLVESIKANVNRAFLLEGYLYPDTYEFYRLSKPQDVIGKFLKNAEAKLTAEDRVKAENHGLSVDQLLTIASLIEKEAGKKQWMGDISSVIHNRLNKGMKLQLDASIFYVERYIKPFIEGDINRYNSFYNTYKCSDLPAGPICNPGRNAIDAALNPNETNYLFFYSDSQGIYHFSEELVNQKAQN